jgi:hypothetical protein
VSLTHVGTVNACSGGIPRDFWALEYVLTQYPSIVAGQITTASNSTINAVLHVDQVLMGDKPSEFILFSRNSPLYLADTQRGLPACETYGLPLSSGRRFIAGLWHGGDGRYDGTLIMETADGVFLVRDPDDAQNTLTFEYDALIDYITHRLNIKPTKPYSKIKTRAVALELSTESGETYLLPADRDTLIKPVNQTQCGFDNPSRCMWAPNGIDTVTFAPLGSNPQRHIRPDYYNATLEGEIAVFSQHSELIMVWAGQELHLYVTAVQWGIAGASNNGVTDIKTFVFNADDPLIPGAGAWSPNGRTFAFSSQSGVWLWDALTPDSEPTLLLATPDEPILVHHYSPAGNYLALATSSRRYHIDITTRHEYPDGLFSPDDRVLAAYDTTSVGLTPLSLYRVLPELEAVWWNYSPTISQFEWINRTTYLYAACGDPILNNPDGPPGFDHPWCKVSKDTLTLYDSPIWTDGILFDYDPITSSLATLIDGDTITVNGEIIELEGQTDSPIVGIELIPLIDLDYRNY